MDTLDSKKKSRELSGGRGGKTFLPHLKNGIFFFLLKKSTYAHVYMLRCTYIHIKLNEIENVHWKFI